MNINDQDVKAEVNRLRTSGWVSNAPRASLTPHERAVKDKLKKLGKSKASLRMPQLTTFGVNIPTVETAAKWALDQYADGTAPTIVDISNAFSLRFDDAVRAKSMAERAWEALS